MTVETKRAAHAAAGGQNAQTKPPLAEFKPHNGVPTLFLQGRPTSAIVVDVEQGTPHETIAAAAQAGANLLRIRNLSLDWIGPNRYDYAELDARIRRIVSDAPNAPLLLEVVVDAPEWWRNAHKGECAVFCLSPEGERTSRRAGHGAAEVAAENGNPDQSEKSEPNAAVMVETAPACASWASRRWLNEAGEALANFARHVHQSAWGERCAGYQIACGEQGAWRHGGWERLPDVGARMTERFRNFCVDKYRRNTGLLRKGWDDPRADFDRIKCPDAYERRYADLGVLRDPLRSRRMLDYFECFYGTQNEAALHFCGLLKRLTQSRALVGLAYAAPFGANPTAEGAQGLPETVFDSPDVDFCVDTPTEHDHLYSSAFTGSLSLRDKFLFHTANPSRSAILEAGLAQTYVAGVILPTATPPGEIGRISRLGERGLLPAPGGSKRQAQVAVIADAFGPAYIGGKDDTRAEWGQRFFEEQMRELAQTGVPFDTYLLSDLFHPKFRDHKVYVFLNTLYLSEAERRRIDARVKRSAQYAVWFWGAGLLTEIGIEADAGEKLIGLKLRMEKKETSLRVRVVEGNDPLTWGLHTGAKFGPEPAIMPTLTVGDKTAARLGANSDNKTVFAARRGETWTSVHFGTFPVPATLLRNVLKSASVHLYADTAGTSDRIVAGTRSLAVNSKNGGVIRVFLPSPHEIANPLLSEKTETGSEVSLTLAANETKILSLKALPRKKEDAPTKQESELKESSPTVRSHRKPIKRKMKNK